MARLSEDSDDELPDLRDIIDRHARKAWPQSQPPARREARSTRMIERKPSEEKNTMKVVGKTSRRMQSPVAQSHNSGNHLVRTDGSNYNSQRQLSGLSQTQAQSGFFKEKFSTDAKPELLDRSVPFTARATPGRSAKRHITYHDLQVSPIGAAELEKNCSSESDAFSGYEESDKSSKDGFNVRIPGKKSLLKKRIEKPNNRHETQSTALQERGDGSNGLLPSPKGVLRTKSIIHSSQAETDLERSSDSDNVALLKFSPPRPSSPGQPLTPAFHRPCTPPPVSPPKNRLTSPSKKHQSIPAQPHRPSLGTFWDQDIVNGWTEQHSPRKILNSPSKSRFLDSLREMMEHEDRDAPESPTSSPKKARDRSPKKTDAEKRATAARKTFESEKHAIASKFLEELDRKITGGKIGEMANDGKGVNLEWNRKLNSTAGRAHWRKEGRREKDTAGHENGEIKFRHEAKIELAEKVIDCEERLINVIAHEYCHLACFMISGIRDNPHGKEFKAWARKCTTAFGHRNIEVTTKHSYVIDYKYTWACTSCGTEYKRHSKSIDPSRHACGSCKESLVQIKPRPRGAKGPSGYQEFVKKLFKDVKQRNPGMKHGEIMEVIGKMYRESKTEPDKILEGSKKLADTKLGGLVDKMEVLVIEDD